MRLVRALRERVSRDGILAVPALRGVVLRNVFLDDHLVDNHGFPQLVVVNVDRFVKLLLLAVHFLEPRDVDLNDLAIDIPSLANGAIEQIPLALDRALLPQLDLVGPLAQAIYRPGPRLRPEIRR